MRSYDPEKPLIFIHIPKMAGQSVFAVMKDWFPGEIARHYYDEVTGTLPVKHELDAPGAPRAIYGHFNRNRGFGIQAYYPQVTQFATILRHPFDAHVSRYYYTLKASPRWHPETRRKLNLDSLEAFIEDQPMFMLEHFPCEIGPSDYRSVIDELFVDIGTVETLSDSLRHLSGVLHKPVFEGAIPHKNATDRPEGFCIGQDARRRFAEKWPLEHAIYDYAAEKCRGRT